MHFFRAKFKFTVFSLSMTPENTHFSSGKFLSTKTCYPESFLLFMPLHKPVSKCCYQCRTAWETGLSPEGERL